MKQTECTTILVGKKATIDGSTMMLVVKTAVESLSLKLQGR